MLFLDKMITENPFEFFHGFIFSFTQHDIFINKNKTQKMVVHHYH